MYTDIKNKTGQSFDANSYRFVCLCCKLKTKNRKQMIDHVVSKHSSEAIEGMNQDDEEAEEFENDETFEDERMEMDGDDIDEEEDEFCKDIRRTPRKKSKSLIGRDFGSKAPPLYHDRQIINEEIKFRDDNFCMEG